MAEKTNLKKIILIQLSEDDYNYLIRIIDPEWQVEDSFRGYNIRGSRRDVTFIREANIQQNELES